MQQGKCSTLQLMCNTQGKWWYELSFGEFGEAHPRGLAHGSPRGYSSELPLLNNCEFSALYFTFLTSLVFWGPHCSFSFILTTAYTSILGYVCRDLLILFKYTAWNIGGSFHDPTTLVFYTWATLKFLTRVICTITHGCNSLWKSTWLTWKTLPGKWLFRRLSGSIPQESLFKTEAWAYGEWGLPLLKVHSAWFVFSAANLFSNSTTSLISTVTNLQVFKNFLFCLLFLLFLCHCWKIGAPKNFLCQIN